MDAHPGFFIKELERLLTKVTPYRAPPKKWVQMLAAWTTKRTCAKGVVSFSTSWLHHTEPHHKMGVDASSMDD
jgi:hypothetical protein